MGPRGRGRKPRVGEAMTLPLAARLVSRGRNGAALEILRREARVRAPLSGSRSTSEEGTRRSVRRQVNMVVGQAIISLGVRDPFQEGVPTAGRAATTAGREIRSGLERLDGTSTGHQEEPVTGAQAPRAVTVLAATVLTVATVPMAISLPMAATVVMATSVPTAATGLMATSVPTATSVLYGGDRAYGDKRTYGSDRSYGDKRAYGGDRAYGRAANYGQDRRPDVAGPRVPPRRPDREMPANWGSVTRRGARALSYDGPTASEIWTRAREGVEGGPNRGWGWTAGGLPSRTGRLGNRTRRDVASPGPPEPPESG